MQELLRSVEIDRNLAEEAVAEFASEEQMYSFNYFENRLLEVLKALFEVETLPLPEKKEKKAGKTKKEGTEEEKVSSKDRLRKAIWIYRYLSTKIDSIRSAIERMEQYRLSTYFRLDKSLEQLRDELVQTEVARLHLKVVEEYYLYMGELIRKLTREESDENLKAVRELFSSSDVSEERNDMIIAFSQVEAKKLEEFRFSVTNASFHRKDKGFTVQVVYDENEGEKDFITVLEDYFGKDKVKVGSYKVPRRIIIDEIPFEEANLLANFFFSK